MNFRSDISGLLRSGRWTGAVVTSMVLVVGSLQAQEKPQVEVPIVSGSSVAPGRVIDLDSAASGSPALDPNSPGALRATRAEQQPVSAEIRAQLLKFESARDAYLKRQKELSQQLKGAGEEQRKVVREQLKGLRDQWLEQSLQFRREARSRIADLKTDLPQFEALKNSKPALDGGKPDRRLK